MSGVSFLFCFFFSRVIEVMVSGFRCRRCKVKVVRIGTFLLYNTILNHSSKVMNIDQHNCWLWFKYTIELDSPFKEFSTLLLTLLLLKLLIRIN